MLDLSHLPQAGGTRLDVFTSTGNSNDVQVWSKPRNCSFVYILGIGAGGGGGGGGQVSTGAGGGGGGGGSGAYQKLFIPAGFLPNQLFLQVGLGGAGGAAAGAGTAGTLTQIRLHPSNATNIVGDAAATFVNGGGGGGAGSASAGTAGAAGTSSGGNAGAIKDAGLLVFTAGVIGQIGVANNTDVPATTTSSLTSQAGGGAGFAASYTPQRGGTSTRNAWTGSTIVVPGGAGATGSAAQAGGDGFGMLPTAHNPYGIFFMAGGGGGSSDTAGGAGGRGFYGCGGGGGGARRGAASGGGVGGRGGDGIVMIWTF